jgi:hypothetical protein
METLGLIVGWTSLVLGILAMLMGLVLAWNQRKATPPARPEVGLGEQAGIDKAIEATTEFAKALKDLDRAAQLFMVGVLFIAIAALIAGFDAVATAIEGATG